MSDLIPFNLPHLTGREVEYILDAYNRGQLAGDGKYTALASTLIQNLVDVKKSLITHSCTAALEMIAILLDIQPGDEIIMPSFTFVSTANAFVLRGAIPVFVDVDSQTFNIDPQSAREAITSKTRAIVVVHYAGVSCDMDEISSIGSEFNLPIIEDAAQALLSTYKGRKLGSLGAMSSLSFHETKNIISGEGGALLINDSSYLLRAEVIREKGTNRSQFFRGEVDKYTWVDIGSSFLPGEVISAFLYAQLQDAMHITNKRLDNWRNYSFGLAELETLGHIRRMFVPTYCSHNAHMFYILLDCESTRRRLISFLKAHDIYSVFHYVPLHNSPAGIKYGRAHGNFNFTTMASESLLRLPMGYDVNTEKVMNLIFKFFGIKFS